MNFFQNRYYRFNKILLSCVGQWPLQSRKERYFFRTATALLVGSILIPKLIALYEYLNVGDVRGMIECLPVLGLHFRSVVKFINSIVKTNTIKQLTINIQETWSVKTADFEQALLKRYAERGKLISIVYAAYIYSVLYMYLSLPFIPVLLDVYAPLNESRPKMHLYEAQYFIDKDENYFYLLAHAYMTMPISLGMIVAYDAMFAVYVQHSCCIFAILGARLEMLGKNTKIRDLEEYAENVEQRDETYAYIADCIKIHKEAMEYAKLLEASGNECYVFVVGISMLGTTLTGFMTVKNLDDPSEALRFGTFAFGEVLHMFYLCWQGHTLVEHSENVFLHAYTNVDWTDLPPPSKKLLILMMMRSLEPCKLTAGKVFVLSMESYAAALKTSMSYFTVLLSMQ